MEKYDKQQYLDKNGVKCLYCKSRNIKSGTITTDEDFIYQKVNCLTCGKTWLDVYTLTDVLTEN